MMREPMAHGTSTGAASIYLLFDQVDTAWSVLGAAPAAERWPREENAKLGSQVGHDLERTLGQAPTGQFGTARCDHRRDERVRVEDASGRERRAPRSASASRRCDAEVEVASAATLAASAAVLTNRLYGRTLAG